MWRSISFKDWWYNEYNIELSNDLCIFCVMYLILLWWCHQMETFSAFLAICAGNSPVIGEFPAQRSVTRSFDVFFYLRLHERLSENWRGWWFETPSRPLWRHSNVDLWLCSVQTNSLSVTLNKHHIGRLPLYLIVQLTSLPQAMYIIESTVSTSAVIRYFYITRIDPITLYKHFYLIYLKIIGSNIYANICVYINYNIVLNFRVSNQTKGHL